jgi:hypothetical protein
MASFGRSPVDLRGANMSTSVVILSLRFHGMVTVIQPVYIQQKISDVTRDEVPVSACSVYITRDAMTSLHPVVG